MSTASHQQMTHSSPLSEHLADPRFNCTDADAIIVSESDLSGISTSVTPESHVNSPAVQLGISTFYYIFACILMQYLVVFFDYSFVYSVHPAISSEFSASSSASWLEISFLLTSTIFQPLAARMSDVIGRRSLQMLSLLLFSIATFASAVSPTMAGLVLSWALSGIGAGGVIVMGPVIANDIITLPKRGTYQGLINLAVGLGLILGSGLGGLLCDQFGWRSGFIAQLPIIAVAFVLAHLKTPPSLRAPFAIASEPPTLRAIVNNMDILGSLLLATTVGCAVVALDLSRRHSTPGMVLWGLYVASLASGLMLFRVERRAPHPVMPLSIVTTQPRANIIHSSWLTYMANSSIMFNSALWFQALKLTTVSQSGMLLMIPSSAVTVSGVCSGLIVTATGKIKPLAITGTALVVLGSSLLYYLDQRLSKWALVSLIIPTSVGMGLNTPAISVAVLATTCHDDQAVMTATLALWRRLGALLGVTAGSMVLQRSLYFELHRTVTGLDRERIINGIMDSVRSIQTLHPAQQLQGERFNNIAQDSSD